MKKVLSCLFLALFILFSGSTLSKADGVERGMHIYLHIGENVIDCGDIVNTKDTMVLNSQYMSASKLLKILKEKAEEAGFPKSTLKGVGELKSSSGNVQKVQKQKGEDCYICFAKAEGEEHFAEIHCYPKVASVTVQIMCPSEKEEDREKFRAELIDLGFSDTVADGEYEKFTLYAGNAEITLPTDIKVPFQTQNGWKLPKNTDNVQISNTLPSNFPLKLSSGTTAITILPNLSYFKITVYWQGTGSGKGLFYYNWWDSSPVSSGEGYTVTYNNYDVYVSSEQGILPYMQPYNSNTEIVAYHTEKDPDKWYSDSDVVIKSEEDYTNYVYKMVTDHPYENLDENDNLTYTHRSSFFFYLEEKPKIFKINFDLSEGGQLVDGAVTEISTRTEDTHPDESVLGACVEREGYFCSYCDIEYFGPNGEQAKTSTESMIVMDRVPYELSYIDFPTNAFSCTVTPKWEKIEDVTVKFIYPTETIEEVHKNCERIDLKKYYEKEVPGYINYYIDSEDESSDGWTEWGWHEYTEGIPFYSDNVFELAYEATDNCIIIEGDLEESDYVCFHPWKEGELMESPSWDDARGKFICIYRTSQTYRFAMWEIVKEGYTFDGFYSDPEYKTRVWNWDASIAGESTIYCKLTKNEETQPSTQSTVITEESKTEDRTTESVKTEEKKTEENKTEENKIEESKSEDSSESSTQDKVDETKTEESKSEEGSESSTQDKVTENNTEEKKTEEANSEESSDSSTQDKVEGDKTEENKNEEKKVEEAKPEENSGSSTQDNVEEVKGTESQIPSSVSTETQTQQGTTEYRSSDIPVVESVPKAVISKVKASKRKLTIQLKGYNKKYKVNVEISKNKKFKTISYSKTFKKAKFKTGKLKKGTYYVRVYYTVGDGMGDFSKVKKIKVK